jgi:hypothetical protein
MLGEKLNSALGLQQFLLHMSKPTGNICFQNEDTAPLKELSKGT